MDSTDDVGPASVTIRGEDTIYVPAAALFRLCPTRTVDLGADPGYAFGLNDFSENGFCYKPTLSINLSHTTALNFSYTGINNDTFTWSTISAGVLFLFWDHPSSLNAKKKTPYCIVVYVFS